MVCEVPDDWLTLSILITTAILYIAIISLINSCHPNSVNPTYGWQTLCKCYRESMHDTANQHHTRCISVNKCDGLPQCVPQAFCLLNTMYCVSQEMARRVAVCMF